MLPLFVSPSFRQISASDFTKLLLVSSNTSSNVMVKGRNNKKPLCRGFKGFVSRVRLWWNFYAQSIVPVIVMRLRRSCVLLSK